MATYVNDLRLTELATGEGSGTWGVTTNTNLELIGEALGYGTQDCFATDADATTTVADGASDPARAMYFKVTSSATLTATRTLTIGPNTVSRVMLIENATTGAQSIAISQGTGGNVTIASGQVKMVYLDGAGAGAAVVDALADLELGTITVANLTATTADINGGTIDGATIGGASAAAGTFTNLTATGTTTLAGASTTADITFGDNDKAIFGAGSDLQIYHSGSHSIIDEAGDGDLYLRSTNGDAVFIYSGGTTASKKRLAAKSTGEVELYYGSTARLTTTATGIDVTGTVTADGLTVDGDAVIASTVPRLILNETDVTNGNWDFRGSFGNLLIRSLNDDLSTASNKLGVAANGDISFYEDTGTTPKFFWDASAEALGIGTTTTAISSKLQVASTTTALDSGGTIFASTTDSPAADIGGQVMMGGYYTGTSVAAFGGMAAKKSNATDGNYDGYLQFLTSTHPTGNTEKMRIDASGNVGIGTSSPGTALDVNGVIQSNVSSGNAIVKAVGQNIGLLQIQSSTGSTYAQMSGFSGTLQLNVSTSSMPAGNAGQFVLDTSGNVGIGDSSPSTYGKLVVAGSTPFAVVRSTDTTSAGFSMLVNSGSNGVGVISTDNGGHMTFDTGSTGAGQAERMRIDSSGNLLVGKTATNYNNDGFQAFSGGFLHATGTQAVANSGTVATLNRKSTDGSIVDFRKDGTLVGSIGTASSGDLYIADGRDAGLKLDGGNNQILPVTSAGAQLDNTLDLGKSDTRFKDLYLSGTANAGGLTVEKTGASQVVADFSGTGANAYIQLNDGNSTTFAGLGVTTDSLSLWSLNKKRIDISSGGDISFYEDTGTTPQFFWDASAEVLGIGTTLGASFAAGKIVVNGGTLNGTTYIGLVNASIDQFLKLGINGNVGQIGVDNSDALAFGQFTNSGGTTFSTEFARFDASGNLLVGTTGTSSTVAGTVIYGGSLAGVITHTYAGRPLYINRLSSDGDIIELAKDGTTVGSIGTNSSGLYIGSTEGSDSYLGFFSNAITPSSSTGAARDDAIDLGNSFRRFKDLYLSGGVYLGGTGAANLLDDYEEGTWTVSFGSDGGVVGTTSTTASWAHYTKVGRLVTVSFYWAGTLSSFTGVLYILGLPYSAPTESAGYPHGGSIQLTSSGAGTVDNDADYNLMCYGTALYPRYTNGASAGYLFNTSTADNLTYIAGTVTYRTT